MREVIWYGHRSGKYLCNVDKIESKKNKEIEKNIDKSLDEKLWEGTSVLIWFSLI